MRALALCAVALCACATTTPEPYPIAKVEPVVLAPPPARTTTVSGTVALSIEDAIYEALANNRDLRIQRFGPVLAGTFEQIERGVFDPEVFAEFRLQRERASQVARATGERFDVTGTNADTVLGLRQRLPTGTTLEATASHGYDDSDRTPRQQAVRLGLSVTQSLLRGFGPAVNLARLDQARLDFDASVHELEGYAQAVIAAAEIAYWRFVMRTAEIAIHTRSLEVAKSQENEVAQRIDVGLLPPLEAAAAQAEVARRKQAVIDAKSLRRAAELQLARMILLDVENAVTIDATSAPRTTTPALAEAEAHVALALKTRPEIEEAETRLEQRRLDTVVTENGILPRLDFFVALGKTGFDSSARGSIAALTSDAYDIVAGLQLSDMLGHRATNAIDRAARVDRRRSEEAVANLRQAVSLEVRLALNEVERARAQIDATAVTRSLQEKAVAAEKERFDVGDSTALLVASAQRDLLMSEIDEVRAVVDYRIALVNLYRSEGTLLARRGITLSAP